jgi:hypothetical protein
MSDTLTSYVRRELAWTFSALRGLWWIPFIMAFLAGPGATVAFTGKLAATSFAIVLVGRLLLERHAAGTFAYGLAKRIAAFALFLTLVFLGLLVSALITGRW